MIKFDLTSVKDSNGFVRLNAVPGFAKFEKMFKRISPNNTCNPHDELYKDYTSKTYSANYGEYDFAAICPAEMFLKRISKYLPTGTVMWADIDKTVCPVVRINKIINIFNYSYVNTRRANSQSIKIHYIDEYGNYDSMVINVNDLHNIIFKPLTKEEVKIYEDYVNLIEQKAAPIYEHMVIKPEYKESYKSYLDDCKKYGFTPIGKALIKNINLNYSDNLITLTKDGKLGGAPNDDVKIVNI